MSMPLAHHPEFFVKVTDLPSTDSFVRWLHAEPGTQEAQLEGLPSLSELARRLRSELGLTQESSAALLGISRSKLNRDEPPGFEQLDRLHAIGRRIDLVRDIFGDDTPAWLARPNPNLGGLTPLQLLGSRSGQDELDGMLQALIDGNFA